MSGFDENPFGEPTVNDPFSVRFNRVKETSCFSSDSPIRECVVTSYRNTDVILSKYQRK